MNAQFSQSQENDADAYGMQMLKKQNINPAAAASALRKLGNSRGGFFSTHPGTAERAAKMENSQPINRA